MHTSCNFLSAILYHPSLSAFLIYHPDSGWHVTSSDQGLSFPEERAWERGCVWMSDGRHTRRSYDVICTAVMQLLRLLNVRYFNIVHIMWLACYWLPAILYLFFDIFIILWTQNVNRKGNQRFVLFSDHFVFLLLYFVAI